MAYLDFVRTVVRADGQGEYILGAVDVGDGTARLWAIPAHPIITGSPKTELFPSLDAAIAFAREIPDAPISMEILPSLGNLDVDTSQLGE